MPYLTRRQGLPLQARAAILVRVGAELKRVIGFWGGTALIVGITIGSGIFAKPYTLANALPHPVAVLGLWIAFGVISLCGALALAELAAMMPATGGVYVYLRAAYGDAAAFVFGWLYLLISTPATVGALAVFFSTLLFGVLGVVPPSWALPLVSTVTIALLTGANLLGAKLGSAIQSLFTAIKVFALVAIIGASFFLGGGNLGNLSGGTLQGASFGAAVASVIWAYDGWVAVSMVAGEVEAAEKRMTRIIVTGMLAIVALYGLANVAYFNAMPLGTMKTTRHVPQAILSERLGPWAATGLGVCIMASVFGALNGNVLTKPRVAYALSRDGLTFAFLGRAHERWGTPHAALVIQGAVAALMTWGFYLKRPDKPGDLFDALTTYFVVVEWFALLFAVGAVIVLRIRRPVEPRPFRTPLYPWVPLLFIAGTAYGLWHIVRGEVAGGNWAPVWGLLITGAGFPVYFLWRKLRRPAA